MYQLFGEVQIPEAVYSELVINRRFPEESRMIQESKFIKKVFIIILMSDKFYHITQDNYARESALLKNLSAHIIIISCYYQISSCSRIFLILSSLNIAK